MLPLGQTKRSLCPEPHVHRGPCFGFPMAMALPTGQGSCGCALQKLYLLLPLRSHTSVIWDPRISCLKPQSPLSDLYRSLSKSTFLEERRDSWCGGWCGKQQLFGKDRQNLNTGPRCPQAWAQALHNIGREWYLREEKWSRDRGWATAQL